MDYVINIDEFSGPLDLLLHLIKKNDIDIYDISIEQITDQYLEYIGKMEKLDIEIASEYLIMASELMLIKSASLLPRNEDIDDEEELDENISRESLINRLIEYEKYKELTKDFKQLEIDRHDIYTKSPSKLKDLTHKKIVNDTDITIDDLVDAFSKFIERKDKEKPINTKITNKEYSVKKRKSDIKKYLKINKKAEFKELFDIYNKSYVIVTFMSILELAKEKKVILEQEDNFNNIYIILKDENN
ncbi:MAG: segregation/condensation protein A [Bacilli bacterium]|nr:segregation/condensation protein A [Bacilli bacterium]